MAVDPKTRQQLLELVYDLLSAEETAELTARIETDPELAQAYAEARRTAGLLAEGAKVSRPPIALAAGEGASETAIAGQSRYASNEPGAAPLHPLSIPTEKTTPRPEVPMSTTNGPAKTPHAKETAPVAGRPGPRRGRTAARLVAAAAAILVLVSAGAYWWHHQQVAELASAQLRLVVTGPGRFQSGLANRYTVWTSGVTGRPMRTNVELAIHSPDGKAILQQKDQTDEEGRLDLTLPATLKVPDGSRLEVLAVHQDKLERAETPLEVDEPRLATQLAVDKPLYQPGETVFFRSLTLGRFGLEVEGDLPVRFKILDPAGAVVANSEQYGLTDHGVGNGSFTLPAEIAGGQYTLVAAGPGFPEEKRTFFVRHYRLPRLKKELEFQQDSYAPGKTVVADFSVARAEGPPAAGAKLSILATVDGQEVHRADAAAGADGSLRIEFKLPEKIDRGDGQLLVRVDDGGTQETLAKTIPINLGKVEVRFYPEGGDLVAGLENRVYFSARDPLGKPVAIEGKILDPDGDYLAKVETIHEGMGQFSLWPQPGQTYRLEITSPKVADHPTLPEVSADRQVVLAAGLGVFGPGGPLEFNLRAAKAGLPLVASATCRGVPVGQQTLVTEPGANAVSIALDERADGVIRLSLYDYSTTPPRPVAERLVYRRPSRQLRLRLADHHEAYSPGEAVEFSVVATDEEDRPVPEAVLGVAVVDDALVNLADDKTASMPTHFRLATEIEKPEDLEKADFYLGDDPKAPEALDLLLGTQGWRRFVEKTIETLKKENRQDERITRLAALGGLAEPPVVLDNLGEIRKQYEAGLAAYRADRTRAVRAVSAVGFFAAVGLVLLVAMLGLLGAAGGARLWTPALGAAAACALVAALLNLPERLAPGPGASVAFSSFTAERSEGERLARLEKRERYYTGRGLAEGGEEVSEERIRELRIQNGNEEQILARLNVDFDGVADLQGRDVDALALGVDEKRLADAKALFAEAEVGQRVERLQRMAATLADVEAAGVRFDENNAILFPDREVWNRMAAGRRAKYDFSAEDLKKLRFPVRQYAHEHVAGKPGVRSDFAESLYWNPLLICDKQGKAQVRFALCDSVTSFRVLADGHAAGGRIGSGGGRIESRIPFSLEPKLPLEVTAGDRVDLPLAVVNDTQKPLGVKLRFEADPLVRLAGPAEREITLEGGARRREVFRLDVVGQKGQGRLTFRGEAGDLADATERRLRVVPPGFPKSHSYSGRIAGPQEVAVDLPDSWVPGSLEVTLNAFPSTLANLQKGMEGMLQEPNGCFEQASTSNYPNVLSLQYMREHNVADPELTRRGRELLKSGYGKLTGYECKERGYEWFGGDPGHEALTAYGLMEFRDMAAVYPVDAAMLDRTAHWLLARRDGKGGFQRNERALDSFGRATPEITDAYITWALAASGQEGIEAEVTHAVSLAEKSDDPYLVALAASAALKTGQKDAGGKLLAKLGELQEADGRLVGKAGSITRSGGLSLAVETTALAALAWLNEPAYAAQANRAIDWIVKNRQGAGGFGSTQATILALKALVEHAKANAAPAADGTLVVKREDHVIGQREFKAGQHETLSIDGLEAKLTPGQNRLAVSLSGENSMPYTLDVTYRALKPESQEDCPVRLATKLDAAKVAAGGTVALVAKVENVTDAGQPMTVAILGLPAGLEPRPDQLETLKKAKTLDYYETRPREVICYWRSLGPKQSVEVKLDLVAAVPGRYTGPASRAYLYYTAEKKHWVEPLAVEIE